MKKRYLISVISLLLVFVLAVPVSAASYKMLAKNGMATGKYKADITSDGKVDKIELIVKGSFPNLQKVVFKVNGKKAYTTKARGGHAYRLEVIHMTKEREFLYYRETGDSNVPTNQMLLKYDKKKKKLVKVLDLSKYTGQVCKVKGVTKDSFTMNYKARTSLTDAVSFNLKFVYNEKTGRFKVKNNIVKCKSLVSDKYVSGTRFKKNMFKTQKALSAFSNKECTDYERTIPIGKWLTLKKAYVEKDAESFSSAISAFQFQYGSETYWIPSDTFAAFYALDTLSIYGGCVVD